MFHVEKDAKSVRMKIPVTCVQRSQLTTMMEHVHVRKDSSCSELRTPFIVNAVLKIVPIVLKLLTIVSNVKMGMSPMIKTNVFVLMAPTRILTSYNVFHVCLDVRLVLQAQIVQSVMT